MITEPDKGSVVVILNRDNCVNKMMSILEDKEKFIRLGPVESSDKSKIIELNFQKVLKLLKDKLLPDDIYEVVRPLRPRLYGLPKTRRGKFHVRLILSMIGFVQHKLAKCLVDWLQTWLGMY